MIPLDSEILCAVIAACGTVVSTAIAWFVARYSAKAEIIKIKLTWEHEKEVYLDKSFSEMADAVSRFCHRPNSAALAEARAKVASLRASEEEGIGKELDALYKELGECFHTDPVENHLTIIIEKKREAQRNRQAQNTKRKITERLYRRFRFFEEKQLQKHLGDQTQTKQQ